MITQDELIANFEYNPATGDFNRRKKIRSRGRMTGGKMAGTVDKDGYRVLVYKKKCYKIHRLAWLYVYGAMPDGMIDHINMNPSDNRIDNLRIATMSQNKCNVGAYKRNTSGYKGVSFNRNLKKWDSRISYQKRQYYLGLFDTPEEAYSAYCRKAKELHGEFARIA